MSTDDYFDEIAGSSQPTPRSQGGRVVTVKMTFYKGGHTAITAPGCTGLTLNDDDELMRGVGHVVQRVRSQVA
jgi:hypothetical protein